MKELKVKSQKSKVKMGFTLVETLVAIAILLLAIVGPLTIASNSLNSAYYANDQVTAFYLAQEGIEYMRYLRDTNFITQSVSNGGKWDAGISGCTTLCGLDAPSIFMGGTTLINCTSISACPVQYDPATGLYHQVGQQANNYQSTVFFRTVQVTQLSSYEDQINVNVYWAVGNLKAPANFKITEDLFNWANPSPNSSGATPMTNVIISITAGSGNGTITSSPAGISCPSTCQTSVVSGNNIILSSTPNSGYVFSWGNSQGCYGSNSCTITPNSNVTIPAGFYSTANSSTLTVSGYHNLAVTANGSNKNGCSSGCSITNGASVSVGTDQSYSQTIEQIKETYTFAGWTGGACNGVSSNPCTFPMAGTENITANYSEYP